MSKLKDKLRDEAAAKSAKPKFGAPPPAKKPGGGLGKGKTAAIVQDLRQDIFSLGEANWLSGSAVPDKPQNPPEFSTRRIPDLWQEGMECLQANVLESIRGSLNRLIWSVGA